MPAKKKSGGTRKHGRGKEKGDKYRRLKKLEKSHVKKIKKHMEKYKDTSEQIKRALKSWEEKLRRYE